MIYTDKKIKFYGNLEDLLYTTKKIKIPKGDSSLEIINDEISKKQFENQEKELNKSCNINIYDVMKNYQNGNDKALDVLFKWNKKYNKVDFTVPALKSMLIRCINTNKFTGLENVKKIYDEPSIEKSIKHNYKNQKCKGWKKRYVQPVEPEFIEQLIIQTLIEIFKNEPSECPEDLNKIKNYEKKGIDSYEIAIDGKPIAQTVIYIMSNNDISSEKDIYDELKYRVTTNLIKLGDNEISKKLMGFALNPIDYMEQFMNGLKFKPDLNSIKNVNTTSTVDDHSTHMGGVTVVSNGSDFDRILRDASVKSKLG